MTNRNSGWKAEPFLLKPAGKDYLWGGTRLNDDFSKDIPMEPLAETWECSTHADGQSIVASGQFQGEALAEVLRRHPEYLGTHIRTLGELPILIKLIDARQDLSVQVHPDDAYAFEHENGSLGKTEMWYVLDTAEDARIVYGFRQSINREALKKSILLGTVEKYLQKVRIKKDDVFFIQAGKVHAIGAGALIAEIQESSNLTYRLFDYDRLDKNGKKRLTVYYCHPYTSCERGSNERNNRIVRRFFPKGKSLRKVTQADCDHATAEMNGYAPQDSRLCHCTGA